MERRAAAGHQRSHAIHRLAQGGRPLTTQLPYFDLLLEGLERGEPAARLFERYVHWGYWDEPSRATTVPREFLAAMERLNAEVLAPAGLQEGQSVLDAGCGFGGTIESINRSHRRMRLVGLNIDARQLRRAERLARPRDGNTIAFVEGDACALPFEGASFERVVAVECVFHFPSRLEFLREAARVLRPGGRISLSDFVPASAVGLHWPLSRWLERRVAEGYGTMGGDWSQGGYAAMAAQAGLRLALDRDITAHTLPTYRFLRSLRAKNGMGEAGERMRWPTLIVEWLSRLGRLRYRIIALEKPG